MIEVDDYSVDNSFISKYIRDDSCEKEGGLLRERFKAKESGVVEVFGSVGEGESFEHFGSNGFKRGYNSGNSSNGGNGYRKESDDMDDNDEDSESGSDSKPKNHSSAKKEFLKELSDDSLSVDTCSNVSRDWKR